MAFESIPGIKIVDPDTNKLFIIADYFSVYENVGDAESTQGVLPKIHKWESFSCVTENREAFVFNVGATEYVVRKAWIGDALSLVRVRAIVEGAISANPGIEYRYGKRILPPKNLCACCELPTEAYVAKGVYKESEINNSNIILQNSGFDRLIWIFSPIAAIITMVVQLLFLGHVDELPILLRYVVIALFAGIATGMCIYLFCAYSAKMLYGKILNEDPAILQEITFVVCDEGFMAAETAVYDYSDIIRWNQVAYFIETNHVFIIFNKNNAVFWLPKRLFPKELHKELSDFISDRLIQKAEEK